MAGHMGNKLRTIQNLEIIKSDLDKNLIFLKGSIPGSKNSVVLIQKTSKNIVRSTTIEKAKKIKTEETQQSVKKTAPKKEEKSAAKTENIKTEVKKVEKK